MIDGRKEWGSGPWDYEPDEDHWVDEATGLPCQALRNEGLGNWCGYVGVGRDHPLHGATYDEAHEIDDDLYVHGGLTFAGYFKHHTRELICVSEDSEFWWFGFDCAHAWDLIPYHMNKELTFPRLSDDSAYRTLDFVKDQCQSLAAALHNIIDPMDRRLQEAIQAMLALRARLADSP